METNEPIQALINSLQAEDELSQGEKVVLFTQLCDTDILVKELQKQAMLQNVGIVGESTIHAYVYGVLQLICPEKFIAKQED